AEVFRAEDPRQHGMHDIGRGGSGSACGWCWAHSRAPGKSPGRLNAEWGVRNAEWDRRGQTGLAVGCITLWFLRCQQSQLIGVVLQKCVLFPQQGPSLMFKHQRSRDCGEHYRAEYPELEF